MKRIGLVVMALVGICPTLAIGGTFSFSDISYWVGSGSNSAALVIAWNDSSVTNNSLVWGFRWDGIATGTDMLFAVAEADPRLFLCHGPDGDYGKPIYGIGYDYNKNGVFGVSDTAGNTVAFPTDGLAELAAIPDKNDPAGTATDTGDLYKEGWWTAGYWCYGIRDNDVGGETSWDATSTTIPKDRVLASGSWDGWSFSNDYSSISPNNLTAAVPEPSTLVLLVAGTLTALVWQRRKK